MPDRTKIHFPGARQAAGELPTVAGYVVDHGSNHPAGGEFTALWREDGDLESPDFVIDGFLTSQAVAAWLEGHEAGRKAGIAEGRRQGVAFVQSGLRAFIGAAGSDDLMSVLTRFHPDHD